MHKFILIADNSIQAKSYLSAYAPGKRAQVLIVSEPYDVLATRGYERGSLLWYSIRGLWNDQMREVKAEIAARYGAVSSENAWLDALNTR